MNGNNNNVPFDAVRKAIGEWITATKPISNVNCNSIQRLNTSTCVDRFLYIRPQLTKDFYYSTFVHQIFNAGPDLFSAMEIVYSMALTNRLLDL
jgi:hypothetical protein